MQEFNKFLTVTVIFVLFTICAIAQFTSAKIGVNGLTCSACTRSVETGLRKLTFVESVEMSLENKSGIVTFKKGQKVEIEKIASAVTDAGFSVRFLTAEYTFSKIDFPGSECSENGHNFYFVKNKPESKNCSLRFIGPTFQTKKEFAKYKSEFPQINFNKSDTYIVVPVVK